MNPGCTCDNRGEMRPCPKHYPSLQQRNSLRTRDIKIGGRYAYKVRGRMVAVRVKTIDTSGYKRHSTVRIVCKTEITQKMVIIRSPSRLVELGGRLPTFEQLGIVGEEALGTGWPCVSPFCQPVYRNVVARNLAARRAPLLQSLPLRCKVDETGVTLRYYTERQLIKNNPTLVAEQLPLVTWADIYKLAKRKVRRGE